MSSPAASKKKMGDELPKRTYLKRSNSERKVFDHIRISRMPGIGMPGMTAGGVERHQLPYNEQ